MIAFVEGVGTRVLDAVSFFGSLARFSGAAFGGIFEKIRRRGEVLKYVDEIGLASFPLVGIIATFIGMVTVMQTAYTLKKFGAESYVGGLVSVTMMRELGPIMVALVLAGRVGAANAAELGTMKITEQIDALEVLAVDPVGYLVSPRLLAAMVAVPTLFLISVFLAMGGGYAVGVGMVGISSGLYINQSLRFVALKDVAVGLVKIWVFGIIVITASCHEGFRARGGAEGVGRAATAAVVVSFFLIIFANLILTALFYFI